MAPGNIGGDGGAALGIIGVVVTVLVTVLVAVVVAVVVVVIGGPL
jgi:hypothetical protein